MIGDEGENVTKRPNTIKMQRLLQELAECDPRSVTRVRELQHDTRKLLGLVAEAKPARAKAKATRK